MRLAIALTFCAQVAVAGCPTAADLERGIRVTLPDGTYVDYRREPGSLIVEVRESRPAGDGYGSLLFRLVHGFFYAGDYYAELDDAVPQSLVDFGMPIEDLPVPAPDQRISVDWRRTDGFAAVHHSVYTTGSASAITVGDCRFPGFEVMEASRYHLETWADGEWTTSDTVTIYLSDLGVSIPLRYEYGESGPIVLPEAVSISAIE